MPSYRLYQLDGAGKISTGDWIEAEHDEAALSEAGKRASSGTYELWDRKRFVARFRAGEDG